VEAGLRPYGWEVWDEENGTVVRRAFNRFRTLAEAWQAGSTVLDDLDVEVVPDLRTGV
jgi:hypothetical protein